ncbi:hypothetical protein F751_6229 [Auxenochlorella protothecoides]|uniref:Uncharacterized protein n=1 Tax=Auxenochlorella protothecoides TaxID=3075 RepID=A0A087SK24_AUXPR|nr:hypothetical protein F751_6229 [Auxenochlorella protothecoides]KFM26078.1 hypothetical protein F751_6229 [Auxenochlorella protothecoides]
MEAGVVHAVGKLCETLATMPPGESGSVWITSLFKLDVFRWLVAYILQGGMPTLYLSRAHRSPTKLM